MVMADLKIDYSETRSLSTKVKGKAAEFGTELATINTANNNLKAHWQGDDATKYTDAVTKNAKTMKELKEAIEDIGKFLNDVANAYEEVVNTNKGGITTN